MNYAQQIKHPNWQKKRLEVLEAHDFACENCGAKDEELHVHHPFYKRGAMIWEYKKEELNCFCHKCHKDAHVLDERLKHALAFADNAIKMRALGYVDSLALWRNPEDNSTISIDDHEYAEGVSSAFRVDIISLLEHLKEGKISKEDLLRLRRESRILHGETVCPPATEEEKVKLGVAGRD